MPAPAASYLKGNFSVPTLIARRIRRRSDGLDGGVGTFVSNNENEFVIGQSIPLLRGLYVDDVDSLDTGSGVWEHSLNCSGLLTGERYLAGYPDIKTNLEDWDTVNAVLMTTNRNRFPSGALGTFGGTTVCISSNPKPANYSGTVFRVEASFKGIIKPKGYRRSATSNGLQISHDQITVNLENGWPTPRKGTASLPKIVVTDTYFSTNPPPTQIVPGNLSPPNAPPIRVINFTGQDVTSNWPSGWSFTTGFRKLPDVSLYETDWIYEWCPRFLP